MTSGDSENKSLLRGAHYRGLINTVPVDVVERFRLLEIIGLRVQAGGIDFVGQELACVSYPSTKEQISEGRTVHRLLRVGKLRVIELN